MYLKAGSFAICIIMNFGQKSCSKCGLVEFVELVVDEPEQQTTFADTAVTDNDDFYMTLILIHIFWYQTIDYN
jgi:hypothetical protein